MDAAQYWFQSPSGYLITHSFKFSGGYLHRTPAAAGNQKLWTWSAWVKRGSLSTAQRLFSAGSAAGNEALVGWAAANTLSALGSVSAAVFVDSHAWTHLVCVYDSDNASAGDRLRVYENGVRVTGFSTAASITKGSGSSFNGALKHCIGATFNGTSHCSGYMADVHFVDGHALEPTAFGTVNDHGVWVPEPGQYDYGLNGFNLRFSDPAQLGRDFSGRNNHFTPVGAGVNAQAMDAPASNLPVLNPLNYEFNAPKAANLTSSGDSPDVNRRFNYGTVIIPPQGKYYWEMTVSGSPSAGANYGLDLGIAKLAEYRASATRVGYDSSGQKIKTGASSASYIGGLSSNAIVGCAFDATNGAIWWSRNGTWQVGADPASGAKPAWTGLTGALWTPYSNGYGMGGLFNFGQSPFAHPVPAGFVKLSSADVVQPAVPETITGKATIGTAWTFIYTGCIPGRIQYGTTDVTYGNRQSNINVQFLSNGMRIKASASKSVTWTVTTTHSDGPYAGRKVPSWMPITACSN